jgi:hypothetical protein
MALVQFVILDLYNARQAKVTNSNSERDRINENIGGLDVSVHHSAAMQIAKSSHQLPHHAPQGVNSQVRGRVHPLLEIDATVLKHNVKDSKWVVHAAVRVCVQFRLDDIDNSDDVGVIQPPQNGNLAQNIHRADGF